MEVETIRVGISDIKIASSPKKLRTAGLGSCVGIVLFHERVGMAGMIHSMLPDHRITSHLPMTHPGKFVDTGIPFLIKQLQLYGADTRFLRAKLAGGAEMFKLSEQSIAKIGQRNVLKAKEVLAELGIPIVGEETGGHFGRTIEFDTMTNQLSIRTASQSERFI